MKPYEKYKDSGVEWIGEVPEHWEVEKLKWLSPVLRGASPRPISDPKYFDANGEFAWVRIADVSASERYLTQTTETLSELGASLSVKRYPGDLFLSIAGSVGKAIITRIKCCIHDGFVYFPKLDRNPEWLYYIFSAGEAYRGLGKLGTQLNLNTETVGNIEVPLPPESEETKIIKFLDRRTAQIDDLISKKRRMIALLKEERAAVINRAVTKGLDSAVKMKASGVAWIGEVPEHWEVRQLKFIASLKAGHSITSVAINSWAEFPVYGGNGLRGYTDNYTHEGEFALIGRQGALCGSVHHATGRFWASEHAIVASLYSGNECKWFSELLRAMNLNQYSTAAAQPGISVENIRILPIPVPPLKEQKDIVAYLESKTSQIDTTISKAERQIGLLREYRTALISEVVTGKVDVRGEGAAG